MNLSEPFIRRPVMTTLVMLTLFFLGALCYTLLPVSNLPDVNFPVISVKAAYPGASPETMANTVAAPLEKEFMTIPGINNVASTSSMGTTNIVLQFAVSKNIDSAAQDVESAISRARSQLPPNLPNQPTFRKVNPAIAPIVYIALTSDALPLSELYTYANTFIGQRLSMLEGVAQVNTYGSPYAVRVQVDPNRLSSLGITLDEVSKALQMGNPNMPTGRLDGTKRTSMIRANGQLTKASEFEPLIIAYRNNSPVRVRDIGHAVDGLKDEQMRLRFVNYHLNKPAVVLAIQRQSNANTVAVAQAINEALPALIDQLPASVEVHNVFDQSFSIREAVFDVQMTLVLAFILVVLVIFLYLGSIRDTIIPSLVLPMSILITFIVMYFLGYSLDSLSLLALTLAIGFIVDDAIVVLENIVRRIEKGEDVWTASLEGSKQISFTILSMTLSLVAVFIPLLFMSGLVGMIFREFAVTLAVVTLASGVVSLTLTPMLCSRFLKKNQKEKSSNWLNDKMLSFYEPTLRSVLKWQKSALFAGTLSVVFSVLLFKVLPTDFIPDEDGGFIIAYSQAAQGTSSKQMGRYQEQVINILQKDTNIKSFMSIAAFPQFRDGVSYIRLRGKDKRISSQALIQKLYKELEDIPGVNTFIKNVPLIDFSQGTQTKGAYQYALQSMDSEALYNSAENLMEKMQQIPIFQGITSDLERKMPQLNVDIQRDQASRLGIQASNIENALLLAYSGNRISRIETPLDQYDVILELQPRYNHNPNNLNTLFVRSDTTGSLTPLNAVAKWSETLGPASVNHISQLPSVTINFNLIPGVTLSQALKELEGLTETTLAPGVQGKVQGAAAAFKKTVQNTGLLLLLAFLAIYVVLGILYESFIHPLTILSTLPPAILGGLVALYIFGLPLSLYSFLGIILLIGIVKKNGIMMVDYALEAIRTRKISPENAILEASLVRFRPIMMTTVAAIAGALPIALGFGPGAEARRPLGLVIIGGMVLSQLVTLYLTPVIYLKMERFRRKSSIDL